MSVCLSVSVSVRACVSVSACLSVRLLQDHTDRAWQVNEMCV